MSSDSKKVLPPSDTLAMAQWLLDAVRPFEAHEVLEDAWHAAPPAERELWRGLAQVAVGLTHASRGNAPGAARLLLRAAGRIELYPDPGPHDIAVGELVGFCRQFAQLIDERGLAELADHPPIPRLRHGAGR